MIEKTVSRDFKGVWIPRHIWLNKELTLQEKVFLVEIDSLSKSERGCFASNSHFAAFSGLSKCRCSRIINSLISKGWVKSSEKRKGKQIVERILWLTPKANDTIRVLRKCQEPYCGNDKNPIAETTIPYCGNSKGSNTVEIYKNRNTEENARAQTTAKIINFFNYWNQTEKLPKARELTASRRKHLTTRFKEKQFKEHWREIIDKTSASKFLTGGGERGWKADFDWIIQNDRNYTRVLEGRYDYVCGRTEQTKELDPGSEEYWKDK